MEEETPIDKLKLPIAGKKRVVLLMNGSFNPIHLNHVRLLDSVKSFIDRTRPDLQVVGGYLAPTNNWNLRRKVAPKDFCSAEQRLAMARLACADSDWIMVDAWQARQGCNPGAAVSKRRLALFLSLHIQHCQILSVCGPDVLPKLSGVIKSEMVAVFLSRPASFDLEEFLNSDKICSCQQNILIVRDEAAETFGEFSSTAARQAIATNCQPELLLHPGVVELCRSLGITYSDQSAADKPRHFQRPSALDLDIDCSSFSILNCFSEAYFRNFDDEFREIEEGTYGKVLAMPFGKTKQVFAVKIYDLTKRIAKDSKVFQREFSILKALGSHPNIISCFGHCVGQKRAYLVLEYSIRSLRDQIQLDLDSTAPFPFSKFWAQVCWEASKGMVHLEENHVLHRNLTLDNIMLFLSADGPLVAKILDFSVSQMSSEGSATKRGSLRHYAPEAIRQHSPPLHYSAVADVFMFGNCLYELAHGGRLIFFQLNDGDAIKRVLAGEKPLMTALIQPDFKELIHHCWMDPNKRPTFFDVELILNKL